MDQNFGRDRKVLQQGISVLNMQALSLSVQVFLKVGQKSRSLGSKFLVPTERYYHKEYTHVI